MADRRHGTNAMYCAGKCRCIECKKAHAQYNKEWAARQPKVYKEIQLKEYKKDCELCGNEFKIRDKTGFNRYRFCSTECGYKGRICVKTFQGGADHPNWKGGITEENKLERQRFMREMRTLILDRDEYACTECGSSKSLHVDHILSWADHPFMRFDPNNCRTLCVPCHYKRTYGRNMPEDLRFWGTRKEKSEPYGE